MTSKFIPEFLQAVFLVAKYRPWVGIWLVYVTAVLIAALFFITDPVGYLTYLALFVWGIIGILILRAYDWHLTKLTSAAHIVVMPFLVVGLILRLTLEEGMMGHEQLTYGRNDNDYALYIYTWIAIFTWILCLIFDIGDVHTWYVSPRKVCVTPDGFYFLNFVSTDDGNTKKVLKLEPATPEDFFVSCKCVCWDDHDDDDDDDGANNNKRQGPSSSNTTTTFDTVKL